MEEEELWEPLVCPGMWVGMQDMSRAKERHGEKAKEKQYAMQKL